MSRLRSMAPVLYGLAIGLAAAGAGRADDYGGLGQITEPGTHSGYPQFERKYGRLQPFDVKHIKLELAVDMQAERVQGRATNTLTPVGKSLRTVTFDAVALDVRGVTGPGDAALDYEVSDTAVTVYLAEDVAPGEEIDVVIDYSANPTRGLHFRTPNAGYSPAERNMWSQGETEDNRHWFPTFDSPNERVTSEIIVTVDEKYRALSNGTLVDTRHDAVAGTTTYHWRQPVPHAPYLISLVVGNYTELTDDAGGIPLKYYVRPEFAEDAHLSFEKTGDMMAFFQEWIGLPYPYESYSQVTVVDFIYGGMENSSITTLTERTLHDAAAHLTYSSDGLVAHELAHQWWGDLLTCRDWSHLWLNEGFATYFHALYFEHDRGADSFAYRMLLHQRAYAERDNGPDRIPVVYQHYENADSVINRRVYDKGAWVLHMLRRQLGDDLFRACIREYGRRYRGKSVETADLMRTIEDVSGVGMEAFFDQWLYHAGYPEFEVSYSWTEETKTAQLVVKQVQPVDDLTPVFALDVDVLFAGAADSRVETFRISEAQHTFSVTLPARPLYMSFDPEGGILKKLTFRQSKQMALAQLANAPTLWGQVQALESLKTFNDVDVVEAIAGVVRDGRSWELRREAALALSEIDNNAVTAILVEALALPDAHTRQAAAEALGTIKEDAAGEALLTSAKTDASPYVVAAALRGLGAIAYTQAGPSIRDALERESHDDVIRKAAFDALVALEDESALDAVARYTNPDAPRTSRRAAIAAVAALGKWTDRGTDALDVLLPLLADPNRLIRRSAIAALEALGAEAAIPHLERYAATQKDDDQKESAAAAIKAIRSRDSQDSEVKRLRDEVSTLRDSNGELTERLERLEQAVAAPPSAASETP